MYSSDEVIRALRRNNDLDFQGIDMVGCPRPDVIDKGLVCRDEPVTCKSGHEQKCEQHLHIFRGSSLLRIITFRFMRSPTDAGGFIKRDDSGLRSLLRNGIISL
jgi:hypothetical protein